MISLSALSGIQLMQNGTETTIALESDLWLLSAAAGR